MNKKIHSCLVVNLGIYGVRHRKPTDFCFQYDDTIVVTAAAAEQNFCRHRVSTSPRMKSGKNLGCSGDKMAGDHPLVPVLDLTGNLFRWYAE